MKKRTLAPISQYYLDRAKILGFESVHEYHIARGWKSIKDETRIKEYYDEMDPTAVEIPDIPGYFVTPEGVIWKYNNHKYKWAIIRQQSHKSGYKAFQPYINGKRCVKYVHRGVCSAFYGARDRGYEAHHINGDRHDNTINNLVWMPKAEHRSLRKGTKYNKG